MDPAHPFAWSSSAHCSRSFSTKVKDPTRFPLFFSGPSQLEALSVGVLGPFRLGGERARRCLIRPCLYVSFIELLGDVPQTNPNVDPVTLAEPDSSHAPGPHRDLLGRRSAELLRRGLMLFTRSRSLHLCFVLFHVQWLLGLLD